MYWFCIAAAGSTAAAGSAAAESNTGLSEEQGTRDDESYPLVSTLPVEANTSSANAVITSV